MSADPGPAQAQLGVCFSLQVQSGCQGWGGTSQALGLCLIQWLSLTHPALPRHLDSSVQSQSGENLESPVGKQLAGFMDEVWTWLRTLNVPPGLEHDLSTSALLTLGVTVLCRGGLS